MACIKVTPLTHKPSHDLMVSIGFVNRTGISTQSVWGDRNNSHIELSVSPDMILLSEMDVVRLAYSVGMKQGVFNEQERFRKNVKSYADKFAYLITNTNAP